MKDEIPIWAVFPMVMAAILLMLAAIILIFLAGPLAFDVLGPDAPSWQKIPFTLGVMATGVGCGVGSTFLIRELVG